MSKRDRERLEITFGKKDEDLWNYITSFGLPHASLVKSIIRAHMNNQKLNLPVAPVSEVNAVEEIESTVKEKIKPVSEKKTSPFSGLAAKK